MLRKLLFTAFAFSALSVSAQTAEGILAKNAEAMGGDAKMATLTSVKMIGNLSTQGMDIPLTITKSHMKGMRLDIEVMGTANYRIANNEKGYIFMPVMGMTEPKEMDAEEYKTGASQFDVHGPLYNYKEKGSTIEFSGSEKVEGADAYKLKVTNKSGKISTYFIDMQTNRLLQTIGNMKGPDGTEKEITVSYKDYKKNADGFWFAYSVTSPEGPVTFDKIETNITVDENLFKN